jgi:hypothetical protein
LQDSCSCCVVLSPSATLPRSRRFGSCTSFMTG